MADERVGALTARDLGELSDSSANLDMFATRGFQDFLVTLPDDPDFPFEIKHTLSPALPTGIRYELMQATFPTVLYHNPEDQWGVDYITLRATAGDGAQIRVRLTVDDGDATPIQETVDLSDIRGFQVPGPLGSLSTNPTVDDSSLGLDFGAGFDFAANGSHYGPSVELGDDDAGMGWDISADMFGYSSSRHRFRFIPKTESSTYRFAMQIAQADTPVAGEYFLTGGPGGTGALLYLGASTAKLGTGYRIAGGYFTDFDVTNGLTERGRTAKMGEWTNVTYSGTNFTASGALTWTVEAADQIAYKYMMSGKTMFLAFTLNGTSTGGVGDTELRIAIPGGFLAKTTDTLSAIRAYDNGTDTVGFCGVVAGGGYVRCWRSAFSNWSNASANNTTVQGLAIFEVQ